MTLFGSFNAVAWIAFIGIFGYSRFFKSPLSRSRYTTGDMIRSLGLLFMLAWLILVGLVTSASSLLRSIASLF